MREPTRSRTAVQPIQKAEVAGSKGSMLLPINCNNPNKTSIATPSTNNALLIHDATIPDSPACIHSQELVQPPNSFTFDKLIALGRHRKMAAPPFGLGCVRFGSTACLTQANRRVNVVLKKAALLRRRRAGDGLSTREAVKNGPVDPIWVGLEQPSG